MTADPDTRHLFVVRSGGAPAQRVGGRISAYDMDSLKLAGEIPDVSGGHGVAWSIPSRDMAFPAATRW